MEFIHLNLILIGLGGGALLFIFIIPWYIKQLGRFLGLGVFELFAEKFSPINLKGRRKNECKEKEEERVCNGQRNQTIQTGPKTGEKMD